MSFLTSTMVKFLQSSSSMSCRQNNPFYPPSVLLWQVRFPIYINQSQLLNVHSWFDIFIFCMLVFRHNVCMIRVSFQVYCSWFGIYIFFLCWFLDMMCVWLEFHFRYNSGTGWKWCSPGYLSCPLLKMDKGDMQAVQYDLHHYPARKACHHCHLVG